jgi:hypothetical protein
MAVKQRESGSFLVVFCEPERVGEALSFGDAEVAEGHVADVGVACPGV